MPVALSVRQPWAWAIIHGGKDVENRTWKTNYRGPLLIHAGQRWDTQGVLRLPVEIGRVMERQARARLGGIVGRVEIVACVLDRDSHWAEPDMWHWVLRNPEPLPFRPFPGRLGLFQVPARGVDVPAGEVDLC